MATFKPLSTRAVSGLYGLWLILLAISACCALVEYVYFHQIKRPSHVCNINRRTSSLVKKQSNGKLAELDMNTCSVQIHIPHTIVRNTGFGIFSYSNQIQLYACFCYTPLLTQNRFSPSVTKLTKEEYAQIDNVPRQLQTFIDR